MQSIFRDTDSPHDAGSGSGPGAAPMSVLLVDDDRELCRMLAEYLNPEGFKLTAVHDGDEGLYSLGRHHFDLIVLDVMLPRSSGLDVLRLLRQKIPLPCSMLTARGEDIDRVVGLELGRGRLSAEALQPARTRGPHARHPAAQPAARAPSRAGAIASMPGPLSLLFSSRTASARGETVTLTGARISRARGADAADRHRGLARTAHAPGLGRRLTPYDRSIDTHISNIRRKLAAVADEISIVNVRRTGYVLTVAELPPKT